MVSAGLAAAGMLVVVSTVAVLLAAASKPPPVDAEGLRTEGVPTVVTPTVEAQASVTPTTPATSMLPAQPLSEESAVPVSSSLPPTDPIANLRLSIQQQVNTGNLNPLKASTLYPKVDAIAQSLNAGNFDDARKKIQDFRNTLTSLLNGGQLTAAGYDVLVSNLDAIPLS